MDGVYGPLYSYGVKVLQLYQPKWFLAENVGGLEKRKRWQGLHQRFLKKCVRPDISCIRTSINLKIMAFHRHGIVLLLLVFEEDINVEYKIPSTKPYVGIDNTCKTAITVPPIPADAPNNEIAKQTCCSC